jgi:hypothetical protein
MTFKIEKLRDWLAEKSHNENLFIDTFEILNQYGRYNNLDETQLWKNGLICLKEWCE